MTAQWVAACTGDCSEIDVDVNQSVGYSYTGTVKGVTLKRAGYYKLEVWGAQGGAANNGCGSGYSYNRGYGGYSYGKYYTDSESILYITVGGMGSTATSKDQIANGGWNGGGAASRGDCCMAPGSGGGGTHIGTSSVSVSYNSSSHRYERSNSNNLLIVAGGGGGASIQNAITTYPSGGGHKGAGPDAATQSSAGSTHTTSYLSSYGVVSNYNGAIGFGACSVYAITSTGGCHGGTAGGGGGYYGGGTSGQSGSDLGDYASSSGGSGYIGSSQLLSDKGMYMYSNGCTSSTATATKTTCTSSTGAHVANAANTGDGYAKITYLGT